MKIKMIYRSTVSFLMLVLLSTSLVGWTWSLQSNEAISTVNGQPISITEYQDRVRFERWRTAGQIRMIYYLVGNDINMVNQSVGQDLQALSNPAIMGTNVLETMEEDLVLAQAAKSLGIVVGAAAVDEKIREYVMASYDIGDTAQLEPAEVEARVTAATEDFFNKVTENTGIGNEVVRDFYYYAILRDAMQMYLVHDLPAEELRVKSQHILLAFGPDFTTSPTEAQKADALTRANQVLAALQDGQSFVDVAVEHSDDPDTATTGGELGWTKPAEFIPEFRDAVIAAEIGVIAGPVETLFGYYIILVNDRELQPLADDELAARRQQALLVWLDNEMANAEIERHPDWQGFIPETPTYDELLGDLLPSDQ